MGKQFTESSVRIAASGRKIGSRDGWCGGRSFRGWKKQYSRRARRAVVAAIEHGEYESEWLLYRYPRIEAWDRT